MRDKFKTRLVIPIFDETDKIVGFTARTLPSDSNPDRPKYLNSNDSQWFKKGDLWYGLNLAKKAIQQRNYCILVEGNMDVISAHTYGFENTVASQGTSVTREQLKKISYYTKTIYIAFDNDKAGKLNSKKIYKLANQLNFVSYKFIIPNQYKDFDEYLTEKNPKEDEIEVIPYLDYELEQNHISLNSNDIKVREATIIEILDLMINLSEISLELYIQKLSSLSSVRIETLYDYLNKLKSKINHTPSVSNDESLINTQVITTKSLEEENLYLAIFDQLLILKNKSKLDTKYSSKLFFLFQLLKQLINELSNFDSIDSYYTSKQEQLSLFDKTSTKDYILWKNLILFIDKNINRLLLNSKNSEYYKELKNSSL
jgi:DNA primase